MAVRRKKAEGGEGSSLDSLMDALTNVVAVLIFVLLLVNCEVSQKVVKMMEDLVPVTDEQIRQVQEMLKQIEIDKQKMEELLKQPKPSQIDFDELQKAIELLQKQKEEKLKQNNERSAAQAELKKLHDEALAARDEEQKKNVAMQEEIRRLEILLDTTPVEKDIPPTDITIPATRPIPEEAQIYYAYVVQDKVHFLDALGIVEKINDSVATLAKDKDFLAQGEQKKEDGEGEKKSAAERRAEREKEKAEAKKEKPVVFDRDKITPVLSGLDYKLPPGQSLDFNAAPWWGNYHLIMRFNSAQGGTSQEELKQPSNPFTAALSKVRPPKGVVMFRVSPESMYTYALAREVVDKRQIPCGWELVGPEKGAFMDAYFRMHLNGVAIKPTATPPPHDPNRKLPERARETGPKLD